MFGGSYGSQHENALEKSLDDLLEEKTKEQIKHKNKDKDKKNSHRFRLVSFGGAKQPSWWTSPWSSWGRPSDSGSSGLNTRRSRKSENIIFNNIPSFPQSSALNQVSILMSVISKFLDFLHLWIYSLLDMAWQSRWETTWWPPYRICLAPRCTSPSLCLTATRRSSRPSGQPQHTYCRTLCHRSLYTNTAGHSALSQVTHILHSVTGHVTHILHDSL